MGQDLAAGVFIAGGLSVFARGPGKLAAGAEWILGKFFGRGGAAASRDRTADYCLCGVSVDGENETGEIAGRGSGVSGSLRSGRRGAADAFARAGECKGRAAGGVKPRAASVFWNYGGMVEVAGTAFAGRE